MRAAAMRVARNIWWLRFATDWEIGDGSAFLLRPVFFMYAHIDLTFINIFSTR
jgi:hypothetical protein